MKKLLLSTLVVSSLGLASQFAAAADGTITFNGQVTSNTCTINGGTPDFTVTLPTVAAGTLSASGNTAGRTSFNIALTSCTGSSAHTYFEAGPTTDSAGRLMLTTGSTASNVQIQLLNGSDQTLVKAGFADASQNSLSASISGGSATLTYYAEYYATGAAGAGSANSSVMYTIAYN
ncbi:fimbrial protein [Cupriavidus metallidurans]|uniref:Major type 1 subunit fimbrin (Pilin) n=1 Tax=Cupriavidus metallidurans (strain ATCC 43123 / DSM 2839 / NBRC 102507 / CH34) TaxID=266264 RepID=Q1LFG0_CUPMC|nr:fimbrial protein [Cupriavidus metallidurans]ABF11116.1 major type 1 subunit fimbrin (pilin) [Cupriavidus metallidurans CH34]QGS33068.1 type 1 fimbrial protein [Cupriavidus metallidurans]